MCCIYPKGKQPMRYPLIIFCFLRTTYLQCCLNKLGAIAETFAQTPAHANFFVARCSKSSFTACKLRFLRAVRLEFALFSSLCKGF